jgi:hypothetical protein
MSLTSAATAIFAETFTRMPYASLITMGRLVDSSEVPLPKCLENPMVLKNLENIKSANLVR